jgi:hypothetical protein
MLYGSPIQVCTVFGELVDRLQLSLFSISFLNYPKLSLIIYIRKYHNGLPFWHRAGFRGSMLASTRWFGCVKMLYGLGNILARHGVEGDVAVDVYSPIGELFYHHRVCLYSSWFCHILYLSSKCIGYFWSVHIGCQSHQQLGRIKWGAFCSRRGHRCVVTLVVAVLVGKVGD